MVRWLQSLAGMLGGLFRGEGGGVAVYSAVFAMVAVGGGALVLDIGRMGVLRAEMQNRADAGAMAAAGQLDGRAGAQARATAVATNATSQASRIPGDSSALTVQRVAFYSTYGATPVVATGDEDSRFIEVVLEPRRVDFMLASILGRTDAARSIAMGALAVAGSNPYICHAPPLMLCDPDEGVAGIDVFDPAQVGRQIRLKPPPSGGTAWVPGNYGLLALPDGSVGASDTEAALAAVEPADCYTLDVSTVPGVRTSKVENGINARFDVPGGLPYPAPNVINYPKDTEIAADPDAVIGGGTWDVAGYWAARHAGPLPPELDGASRYQVYLWEQGLSYARNGGRTLYPVTGELPAGFILVTPSGTNIPTDPAHPNDPDYDGLPSRQVASNGPARRLLQIAVLQCVADGVRGSHTYPTHGRYVEGFVTEAVDEAPEGGIYIELVRSLTTLNDPDFHANVRLVR